jgi:hypothetical protein
VIIKLITRDSAQKVCLYPFLQNGANRKKKKKLLAEQMDMPVLIQEQQTKVEQLNNFQII